MHGPTFGEKYYTGKAPKQGVNPPKDRAMFSPISAAKCDRKAEIMVFPVFFYAGFCTSFPRAGATPGSLL
jgi:hypothetical protein